MSQKKNFFVVDEFQNRSSESTKNKNFFNKYIVLKNNDERCKLLKISKTKNYIINSLNQLITKHLCFIHKKINDENFNRFKFVVEIFKMSITFYLINIFH